MNEKLHLQEFSCPVPISDYDTVMLAHGGGGRLSHQLIEKLFISQFSNEYLSQNHDGAVINIGGTRIAYSTDSYVVNPVFFPGGNIGELAINGTINDIAMCGAKPLYISLGLIIEEGLPMDELWTIVQSMQKAAAAAGVAIVTGDTKVVDRNKGDKIYINTSGIGIVPEGGNSNPLQVRPGDVILLSGFIADHGIAIMSAREGLQFQTTVISDTAALHGLVASMLAASRNIRVLRDPTRGGIASTLNELSMTCKLEFSIMEDQIPVRDEVQAACELLGFDPLYVANEGKLLAIVPPEDAELILATMKAHPLGRDAAIIGSVTSIPQAGVVMKTRIGSSRIVDMLSGEQLPRIC
jgi:hydrogenase expression/formation protein HypE